MVIEGPDAIAASDARAGPAVFVSPTAFEEASVLVTEAQYPGAYSCLGSALRGGVLRRVRCADAVSWLAKEGSLPHRCHVITSLPDIGELKPKLSPSQYESWFVDVVRQILAGLDAYSVAIFYQTDGRQHGPEETYLDKSYLCHAGARAAGAACLFHRIVCAGPLGLPRSGHVRPAYAHMLCFSVSLRPPRGALQWSDVLPTRGHMSYAGAMGEHACSEAVAFVVRAHRLRPQRRPVGDLSTADVEDASLPEVLPEVEEEAPAMVFDPFCGHGSILAMANAWGLDAFGIDINFRRCEISLGHQLHPQTAVDVVKGTMAEPRGTAPQSSFGQCRGCDGDHPHCRTS